MKKIFKTLILLATLGTSLAGCSVDPTQPPSGYSPITSKEHSKDNLLESVSLTMANVLGYEQSDYQTGYRHAFETADELRQDMKKDNNKIRFYDNEMDRFESFVDVSDNAEPAECRYYAYAIQRNNSAYVARAYLVNNKIEVVITKEQTPGVNVAEVVINTFFIVKVPVLKITGNYQDLL